MRATSATKKLKCKIASFDSCHLSIRLTVSRWEIMTLFCSVICSRHVLGCVLRFSWMCQGEGVHSLSLVLISFFLMKWYTEILRVWEKWYCCAEFLVLCCETSSYFSYNLAEPRAWSWVRYSSQWKEAAWSECWWVFSSLYVLKEVHVMLTGPQHKSYCPDCKLKIKHI